MEPTDTELILDMNNMSVCVKTNSANCAFGVYQQNRTSVEGGRTSFVTTEVQALLNEAALSQAGSLAVTAVVRENKDKPEGR